MAGHKALQGKATKAKRAPDETPRDPLHLERPHAVRLLGISDRTFSRLESEGVINAAEKGTGRRRSVYDAVAIVAAYLTRQEREIRGSDESPRDRKDLSQAELNELRLDRERALVLPREEVVATGQAYIHAVTAKLRSLAPRMVQAGIVPAAQVPIVEEMVEEAISEMAGWSNELELLQAIETQDDDEEEDEE